MLARTRMVALPLLPHRGLSTKVELTTQARAISAENRKVVKSVLSWQNPRFNDLECREQIMSLEKLHHRFIQSLLNSLPPPIPNTVREPIHWTRPADFERARKLAAFSLSRPHIFTIKR